VWHQETHSRCREKLIRHLYWACEKDIYRLSRRSMAPSLKKRTDNGKILELLPQKTHLELSSSHSQLSYHLSSRTKWPKYSSAHVARADAHRAVRSRPNAAPGSAATGKNMPSTVPQTNGSLALPTSTTWKNKKNWKIWRKISKIKLYLHRVKNDFYFCFNYTICILKIPKKIIANKSLSSFSTCHPSPLLRGCP
jgi:hypothetical protein